MMDVVSNLSRWSRREKVAAQLMADSVAIVFSFECEMLFRLESLAFLGDLGVWAAILAATAVTLVCFQLMGLYRSVVRSLTSRVLFVIGKGAMIAAIALYSAGLVFDSNLPRSVPPIFGVFVFITVAGLRFGAQSVFRKGDQSRKQPVIIYGAGDAGLRLLKALEGSRDYSAAALIDDDPCLQGMAVGGLRVHPSEKILHLKKTTGAQIILLALPNIDRARRRNILAALEDMRFVAKTIPNLSDIVSGRAKVSELREVTVEDLLGRDPVSPDPELMFKNIIGRVVMVSGAGGSIGSELCRQILMQKPTILVLFEVSEFALYTIEAELMIMCSANKYSTKIVPVLGSVQSHKRLEDVIASFGVNTIYHAAAYKHVPLIEENVVEGIQNNVFGTLAITSAAKKFGVEKFILISTDKAVRPTNVMGATKRIAELICQAHAMETSATAFSMVRFGNVLGSSGSVIPRFSAQISSGGPVTVTHKEITRYFMTIPEAAQLVVQAGAMGKAGEVYVLDMGEPVRIMDLAFSMVRLHGLTPYLIEQHDQISPEKGDIPICITGLRKGEKLYEELLIGNNPSPTEHSRIMTSCERSLPMQELLPVLDQLRQACDNIDLQMITEIMHKLPLEYKPVSRNISHRAA